MEIKGVETEEMGMETEETGMVTKETGMEEMVTKGNGKGKW
jgi:hypothetical protein